MNKPSDAPSSAKMESACAAVPSGKRSRAARDGGAAGGNDGGDAEGGKGADNGADAAADDRADGAGNQLSLVDLGEGSAAFAGSAALGEGRSGVVIGSGCSRPRVSSTTPGLGCGGIHREGCAGQPFAALLPSRGG